MLMVMFTMENGKMTKLMDMDDTITRMAHDMKEIGSKINSMVMVEKSGQIMPVMRVNTKTEKSMERDNFYGLMALPTPETS